MLGAPSVFLAFEADPETKLNKPRRRPAGTKHSASVSRGSLVLAHDSSATRTNTGERQDRARYYTCKFLKQLGGFTHYESAALPTELRQFPCSPAPEVGGRAVIRERSVLLESEATVLFLTLPPSLGFRPLPRRDLRIRKCTHPRSWAVIPTNDSQG
jgi:hypothetical protein